jgi:hypothetical protein
MSSMDKNQLQTRLQTSRRQLDRNLFYFERGAGGAFVPSARFRLDPDLMTYPGVIGLWSIKDLLSYLIDGERSWVAWFNTWKVSDRRRPLTPPGGPDPKASQSISICSHDGTLEQIIKEYRLSFPQLIAVVEAIPEPDLFEPINFPNADSKSLADTLLDATAQRYDWAKSLLRGWSHVHKTSQRNKATLLNQIQSEHRLLEKLLNSLSPGEWFQPGVVANWSIKDLLAHLTAWERLFCSWYLAGLGDKSPAIPAPGYSWILINRLNEDIFLENRDRPLEEIRLEFQNSYIETFVLVQSIPEEALFSSGKFAWTGKASLYGYVIANTCNHYRWARTKIRAWERTREKSIPG